MRCPECGSKECCGANIREEVKPENEGVTVEIFGKPVLAMQTIRDLVEDLAVYQMAVETAWQDSSIALGCGELLDADDLRKTLERICEITDSAMVAVRRNQEARHPEQTRELNANA
ncbi:hypothetical protein [Methylococcus mesophilus]|uniref:hypothetical protein n=1 Tax=Methylococcus mesophilus TaxID=2993564 RepID=UPI00224A5F55|nr:hypothetical protein [Methylococcus mesophilus]UZR29035.1 hypothetical protein OOT43_20395 [Methylococcus mesophilus]